MVKILKLLRAAVSVYKYQQYATDFYVRHVLQGIWRIQGAVLGTGIVWLGKPILVLTKESSLSIGSGCLICSRSSQTALGVSHPVILRTLNSGAKLCIGSQVRMSGTTICCATQVEIGDRCVIGADVIITDTDFHALEPDIRSSSADASHALSQPVTIASDVFIGGRSIILKGVNVGQAAIIGAGSIVTADVLPWTIVAGNPARVPSVLSQWVLKLCPDCILPVNED